MHLLGLTAGASGVTSGGLTNAAAGIAVGFFA